jgi:hypothetical protein
VAAAMAMMDVFAGLATCVSHACCPVPGVPRRSLTCDTAPAFSQSLTPPERASNCVGLPPLGAAEREEGCGCPLCPLEREDGLVVDFSPPREREEGSVCPLRRKTIDVSEPDTPACRAAAKLLTPATMLMGGRGMPVALLAGAMAGWRVGSIELFVVAVV